MTLSDLLSICRRLPSDFEPWGERHVSAGPCLDCAAGCRHFLPMMGEIGNEWGVCANPKSPRSGLFTFKHQGCPNFESAELKPEPPPPDVIARASGNEEDEDEARGKDSRRIKDSSQRRVIKVDFGDFQMALEHQDTFGLIEGNFLDTETGEILCLSPEMEGYDELNERVTKGDTGRYRQIESLPAHESFQFMEDFAQSLRQSALKARLLDALARPKPFRRFKDIVLANKTLQDQWHQFQDDALAEYMKRWLDGEGIEAELLRPRRN